MSNTRLSYAKTNHSLTTLFNISKGPSEINKKIIRCKNCSWTQVYSESSRSVIVPRFRARQYKPQEPNATSVRSLHPPCASTAGDLRSMAWPKVGKSLRGPGINPSVKGSERS